MSNKLDKRMVSSPVKLDNGKFGKREFLLQF